MGIHYVAEEDSRLEMCLDKCPVKAASRSTVAIKGSSQLSFNLPMFSWSLV